MGKLALLGGDPVRNRPFCASVVVDDEERRLIQEVLDRKEFSRFMGSPTAELESQLVMPSAQADALEGQYFTFLGGVMVRRFEADFAARFEVPFAVSVNSATTGIATALAALGLGPGDEVVTTCLSFNATAAAVVQVNAVPVFADVDPETFCIRPEAIEKRISSRTRAILVVHLLGNAADMQPICDIAARHGLAVVEDCAQAPGTRYRDRFVGSIGDAGVFSFQETKNMQTGEGGMIITRSAELARRMRLIRNHGESIPDETWTEDSLVNMIGTNYRMTELTAALGIAQLMKLPENNRCRSDNARFLARELQDLPGLTMPRYTDGAVPHIFAMTYDAAVTGVDRAKLLAALRAEGIPVGSGYLRLMPENPSFLHRIGHGRQGCPWTCGFYGREIDYRLDSWPVAKSGVAARFVWFYHIHRPNRIDDMRDVVMAFRKVWDRLDDLKTADVETRIGYKW